MAAEVLSDGKHIGQTYTLTGPAALSHGDVAALLSAQLGKPVSHIDVPGSAFYEAGVAHTIENVGGTPIERRSSLVRPVGVK